MAGLFDEEAGIIRPIYRNRSRAVYSRTASQAWLLHESSEGSPPARPHLRGPTSAAPPRRPHLGGPTSAAPRSRLIFPSEWAGPRKSGSTTNW